MQMAMPRSAKCSSSAWKIGRVKVPVLVVHGADDSLIRPELGRALFERASAPKRFVLVEVPEQLRGRKYYSEEEQTRGDDSE